MVFGKAPLGRRVEPLPEGFTSLGEFGHQVVEALDFVGVGPQRVGALVALPVAQAEALHKRPGPLRAQAQVQESGNLSRELNIQFAVVAVTVGKTGRRNESQTLVIPERLDADASMPGRWLSWIPA